MLRRLEKNLTSARAAAAHPVASGSPSTSTGVATTRPANPTAADGRTNANAYTSPPMAAANGSNGWQSTGQPSTLSNTGSNIQYITIPEYSSQSGQIGGPVKKEEGHGHSSNAMAPMMDVMQHSTPSGGSGSSPPDQAQNRPEYYNRQRTFSGSTPKGPHSTHRAMSSPRSRASSPSGSDSEGSSSKPDDGEDRNNNFNLFPAQALADENKRLSFFNTILNPPDGQGSGSGDDSNDSKEEVGNSGAPRVKGRNRGGSMNDAPGTEAGNVPGSAVSGVSTGPFGLFGKPKKIVEFEDPITLGLITEDDANALFELYVE